MGYSLIKKTFITLNNHGVRGISKRVKHYIKSNNDFKSKENTVKDILFINGCSYDLLPHPPRYRIKHQREQLEINGYTTDEIYFKKISINLVRMYRAFVIFRTPITPELLQFIEKAKSFNKKIIFDIDDLVIDTKYTNTISHVQSLPAEQKKQYDSDIENMKRTLQQCDAAITTTSRLKTELSKYCNNVFINRNVASNEMVSLSKKVLSQNKNQKIVRIGYFSGSVTHNEDFNMILPILTKILDKYENIELHLTGEISFPPILKKYKRRIMFHPFVNYRKLPELISKIDINLAPLTNSIFNEAKSEIKWIEAALVKVPTVASDIGAFHEMIQNDVTGILCDNLNKWESSICRLIESRELRQEIAENAYNYCIKNCTTIYTGKNLVNIINKVLSPNIAFAFTKIDVSGGIMVALRHAAILQENGYDVSLLSLYDSKKSINFFEYTFPVLPLENSSLNFHLDNAVATMWPTVNMIQKIDCIRKLFYLVQNFETDFYDFDNTLKVKANMSYSPHRPFTFITISKWCQNWLKYDFKQQSKWIPNGIDTKYFTPRKRNLKGKIKILIEGDSAAKHKNVDESFHVVNKLDPNKYEIWYMSYNAKPKSWYKIDKFFHRIPYEKVADVYTKCDILLKTSLLESFSYPPLEMMATGGYVIAIKNNGNSEYLEDYKNCLFYPAGDINSAVKKIQLLVENQELQTILYLNGIQTAQSRDWNCIKKSIIDAYTKEVQD